ncbi:MAG: metalloregulator ArsR/SmtB family transcription factor [Fimbriimonadaceae bacterium]|nr:metalloregulator ArsR/SmtB family transcription factor [Fimbriimonadaceae bacterium]
MANIFEELGEESRRRILYCLVEGPKNVGEIVDEAGLRQPNVSNHLGRMRAKGIVSSRKVGREVFYSLCSADITETVRMAVISPSSGDVHIDEEQSVKDYARYGVNGDKAGCERVVDEYLRANMSLADIYHNLLCPAMELVGVWYQVEAIDEGQEHLASSITERLMSHIISQRPPIKRSANVAVLGCAPDNWHVIGLRMIGDILRQHGWNTYFLGANVPQRSFLRAVERHRPNLVLISASTLGTEERVEKLVSSISGLRSKNFPFSICGGGRLVVESPERYCRQGLDLWACDIKEFSTKLLPAIEKHGL